jgi:hypothetical protein
MRDPLKTTLKEIEEGRKKALKAKVTLMCELFDEYRIRLVDAVARASSRESKLAAFKEWSISFKHEATMSYHHEVWLRAAESPEFKALDQTRTSIVMNEILPLFAPYNIGAWKLLASKRDWNEHRIMANLPRPNTNFHSDGDHIGEPDKYPCLVCTTHGDAAWEHEFIYEADARILTDYVDGRKPHPE